MNPSLARPSIALQLWSVRDEFRRDFAGTVTAVARMGYPAVELAGYGNLDAKSAAEAVKAAGLRVSGMHVGLPALRANPEQIAIDAHGFGARDVTCPFVSPVLLGSADACRRLGEELGRIGAVLRAYGLRFSFHNHAHELALIDGRRALDWMLDAAAPQDLAWQADVFFLQTSGCNPSACLRAVGRRVPLVHLKDEYELGQGPVDFPALFETIDQLGAAEWLIVEQEKYHHSPMESVRLNLEQLRRWGRL